MKRRKYPKKWPAAEYALQYADSYNRADCIVDLFMVGHPDWIKLLGKAWTVCDTYPKAMRSVLLCLSHPADAAMTDDERKLLAGLPDVVEIWRGCYDHNRDGFSWATDRTVAARFPKLHRYSHEGKTPLLLRGMVRRADILFVKLDRDESEVVPIPGTVRIIEELRI